MYCQIFQKEYIHLTVKWGGKFLFMWHRTPEDIKWALTYYEIHRETNTE
jgi:hypothetical protein